jgi:cytidylate kinase
MIITLSRQYLAGADKVAKRVADELSWTVVDDAFIEALAERSGIDPEDVKGLEERVPSFMERFAQSSALSTPEFLMAAPDATFEPEALRLAHLTRDLVTELGRRDRVVLVGRAAAAVLARERDAIHVWLVASVAHRVREAIRRYGMSEAEARAAVGATDASRAPLPPGALRPRLGRSGQLPLRVEHGAARRRRRRRPDPGARPRPRLALTRRRLGPQIRRSRGIGLFRGSASAAA